MVTLKSRWWWPWRLHAQLVGDSHDHFEDGHEGGDLAEVAAADHLSMDLQTPLVVLAGHTVTDLMEPAQDVGRELREQQGDFFSLVNTVGLNLWQWPHLVGY